VLSASKPRWQQVTAVVSLGASGAVTGFSFVPSSPADLMSPTSMPIRLMALERSAQPAPAGDSALRSAIVNVANYYLRMAQAKTPAEMEAIIWQHDSIDGVDHGESCAAFASLTLELAAQVVGQQSWVTGGSSYPWPLHKWADVRVDPNPASPDIISVLQDAQANGRWHPLGDGYQPQPGDWVLFDGHVEVVTQYAGGVLSTIGGDSLPNFSVNAHEYRGPLAEQGVVGFVNNGDLPAGSGVAPGGTSAGMVAPSSPERLASDSLEPAQATRALPVIPGAPAPGSAEPNAAEPNSTPPPASAAVPGTTLPAPRPGEGAAARREPRRGAAAGPTARPRTGPTARPTAGPTARQPAGPTARQPAGPTARQPAGPTARQPAGPTARQPAGPTARQPAGPTARPTPGPTARQPAGPTARPTPRPATDRPADADVPGTAALGPALAPRTAGTGTPAIPGLPASPQRESATTAPDQRHRPPAAAAPEPGVNAQQAFINEVVPGAVATQRRYGVPAAVTIAQAIDESGWGQSVLASQDNNLFGIKGTGPAGSDSLPTQEYENGQWVTTTAPFRVYHSFAESINDHGELLATSGYYTQAMAERNDPDSFAKALTGVYATNPEYGTDLVQLMQQYDLYRYDVPASAPSTTGPHSPARPSRPAPPGQPSTSPARPSPRGPAPAPAAPRPTRSPRSLRSPGAARPAPSPRPASSPQPMTAPTPAPTPDPAGPISSPGPSSSPRPTSPVRPNSSSRPTSPSRPARSPKPTSSPSPTSSATLISAESPARPAPTATPQSATETDAYQLFPTGMSSTLTFSGRQMPTPAERQPRLAPSPRPRAAAKPYHQRLPASVKNDLVGLAKAPLMHAELLYRDIASDTGISWELLAACDWMQCEARPRRSPVHGEKLGTPNPDGTTYRTKSEALEQCASDLVELAGAVYGIDLRAESGLSVRDLARVFAAFRWGALLEQHHTSAMEFPYSVAGLTAVHLNMRWPNIGQRNTPDKPGARFRGPFGAVPVVLFLNYPATD
jgi:flagellum-specific peptidoglycan hydrolase FlgJ